MSHFRSLLVAVVVLGSLAGCDLFSEDTTIIATGTVIDASLNQPARGVSVALKKGGGLYSPPTTVVSTRTDAEGRFRLEYDPGEYRSILDLQINTDLYDDTFYTSRYSVAPGERSDETTYLYRNATLIVDAETDTPLSDEDSYYLWIPGIGGRYPPITTTRARGNAYNEVRVVVEREGVTSEVVDSVYCPVGEVTEYTIQF
jgi:5-hydroxyisourate hydrolase-like protein (transthyretin family)